MTALEAMRSTVLLAEANRELRGPIQVVLTWAMVLEKQLNALEVGDRRALLGIKRAASRLTSVIDQVLAERSIGASTGRFWEACDVRKSSRSHAIAERRRPFCVESGAQESRARHYSSHLSVGPLRER